MFSKGFSGCVVDGLVVKNEKGKTKRENKRTVIPSAADCPAQREREEYERDGGGEEEEPDEVEVFCETFCVEEAFLEGGLSWRRCRLWGQFGA